jgi:hypothetical protein
MAATEAVAVTVKAVGVLLWAAAEAWVLVEGALQVALEWVAHRKMDLKAWQPNVQQPAERLASAPNVQQHAYVQEKTSPVSELKEPTLFVMHQKEYLAQKELALDVLIHEEKK